MKNRKNKFNNSIQTFLQHENSNENNFKVQKVNSVIFIGSPRSGFNDILNEFLPIFENILMDVNKIYISPITPAVHISELSVKKRFSLKKFF